MKKYVLFAFTIILFVSAAISAQTKATPKTISAGVVNGKAKVLAKPEYPPAAAAVRASGQVVVQVTINEQGNVISAKAVSGHELLRGAAESAALQSKFAPTTLSGQPVKVTGTIIYNFQPIKSNEEKVMPLGIGTVLYMFRGLAADLNKLNQIFDTQDFTKEIAEDLPAYSKELSPLNSMKNAPVEKRIEIIDGVIASIRAKMPAEDVWQFEMGKNFGEFFAQMIAAFDGENFDIAKLDEAALRLNLTKIDELIFSAPSDFPVDVLDKFKEFAALKDKQSIVSEENLPELIDKAIAIVETISPNSTK